MARGNTVYLKSESGRVENFDQFRERIKTLSNPENLRFNELRQLLKREAQPLVDKAREEAYNEVRAVAKSRRKTRNGQTATKNTKGAFYNLYKSIDSFTNKGTEKAYVVIGLRSSRKKGAYYAPWQLFGGTKKGFQPKKFIDAAVKAGNTTEKAQKVITNFVQKRIKAHLR
jgi:hypothetical protein